MGLSWPAGHANLRGKFLEDNRASYRNRAEYPTRTARIADKSPSGRGVAGAAMRIVSLGETNVRAFGKEMAHSSRRAGRGGHSGKIRLARNSWLSERGRDPGGFRGDQRGATAPA